MKTSIEIITDKNNNKIHFCATNIKLGKRFNYQNNFDNDMDFAEAVVKALPNHDINEVYLHDDNSIVEIDFNPKNIKKFDPPADVKPEFDAGMIGNEDEYSFYQYIFDDGSLKDVPYEIVDEAKQINKEFIEWFNSKFSDYKIKENVNGFTPDDINISYFPEENIVWIRSNDHNLGEEYECTSKKELKDAINDYIDKFIIII